MLKSWTVVYLSLMTHSVIAQREPPLGTCYFSDRNIAAGYKVCRIGLQTSECCPSGFSCFSGRLCMVTDERGANSTYPVGSTLPPTCTDPTGSASECGSKCLTDDGRTPMIRCTNDTYCCGQDAKNGNCDCKTGRGTVIIPLGSWITAIDLSGAVNSLPPPLPTGNVTSTSSRSVSTPTTSPTSSSTNTSTATATPDKGLSKEAKIGVGVGVAVAAVIIIGLVACCLNTRRKRIRRQQEAEDLAAERERQQRRDAELKVDQRINPVKPVVSSLPRPIDRHGALASDEPSTALNNNAPKIGPVVPVGNLGRSDNGTVRAPGRTGANAVPRHAPQIPASGPSTQPPTALSPTPTPRQVL